jgi:hypothetical protein
MVTLRRLADMDAYRRTWQQAGDPGTPPAMAALAGQNLLVLGLTPASTWPLVIDVVQNVPVFADDDLSAVLQVDEPLREGLLDYCQHLAVFKEGVGQTQSTMALLEAFQRVCGVTQVVDSASVPHRGPLLQQTRQDPRVKDREAPVEPALP